MRSKTSAGTRRKSAKIVQTIRIECEILEDLAGLVKATLAADDPVDPVLMVQEFARAVNREVDLANEAMNMRRFARNFKSELHVAALVEQGAPEVLNEIDRI